MLEFEERPVLVFRSASLVVQHNSETGEVASHVMVQHSAAMTYRHQNSAASSEVGHEGASEPA